MFGYYAVHKPAEKRKQAASHPTTSGALGYAGTGGVDRKGDRRLSIHLAAARPSGVASSKQPLAAFSL